MRPLPFPGQTWDVISPLNPGTLNYSVAWWAGNIGYRRPQIRLIKSYAINNDLDLKLEGALARNIGSGAFSVTKSGEDSGQSINTTLNAGGRSVNSSIFGNMIYSFNKNTDLGFEISRWRTDYKDEADADDLRVQSSFIYKF